MPRSMIINKGEAIPEGYRVAGTGQRPGMQVRQVLEPIKTGLSQGFSGRQKYEESLYNKYGDPYKEARNLNDQINTITTNNERALFKHVFGNQIGYGQELNPEVRAYWEQARGKYRKQVGSRLKMEIDQRKERIDTEMKAYDAYSARKGLSPSAQLSQRKLETYDVRKRNEANEKILDLLAGRTVKELDNNEKIALKGLLDRSGFELGSEDVPAETGWFGREKTPATTRNILAPRGQVSRTGLMPRGTEARPTSKDLTAKMPPAGQHKDKIIKDTETNKRYKSDGTQWIEID